MATSPTNMLSPGSNQYASGWQNINFPATTGSPQNPFGTGYSQYGGGFGTTQNPYSQTPSSGLFAQQTPGAVSTGGGYQIGSTLDPSLTSNLFGYLQSQIGQGTPTYPGQLTAPPNQLYQQIGNLLTGQTSSLPYGQQYLNMATTGAPTDVGPAWNAMVAAQQQNIAQNYAQLKEQFAAGGNLVGTPYGTAAQDYASQTAAQQNALLAQMQQQASEAAAGRQLTAQEALTGTGMALGGQLQNINQTGLTNAYNEWLRTQPQYNPLLGQAYGASTTFPAYLNPQANPWLLAIPGLANILSGIKWPSGQPTQNPTAPSQVPDPGQVPIIPAPNQTGSIPSIPGIGSVWGQPSGTTPPIVAPPSPTGNTPTGGGGGGYGTGVTITMPGGQPGSEGGTTTIPGVPGTGTGAPTPFPGGGGVQSPIPGGGGIYIDPTTGMPTTYPPSTGVTIDPTTGQPIDPVTGLPIGQGSSSTGGQAYQDYMNYLASLNWAGGGLSNVSGTPGYYGGTSGGGGGIYYGGGQLMNMG